MYLVDKGNNIDGMSLWGPCLGPTPCLD